MQIALQKPAKWLTGSYTPGRLMSVCRKNEYPE